MARIPGRFQRVAAAFDEVARVRLCESSGSEHSPESSSTDLSILVNSFIERGEAWNGDGGEEIQREEEKIKNEGSDDESCSDESEKKDMLRKLFGQNDDVDDVKRKIYGEAEAACEILAEDTEFHGFKRRLMTHLRDRGFDAGTFIFIFWFFNFV